MSGYSELLKDPRWQKRRLEVMQRTGFSCEVCGAKDKQLNVHHRLYRRGAAPWDYADSELSVLCVECHEEEHKVREALSETLALLDLEDLREVLGYAQATALANNRLDEIQVDSIELAMGILTREERPTYMDLYEWLRALPGPADAIPIVRRAQTHAEL